MRFGRAVAVAGVSLCLLGSACALLTSEDTQLVEPLPAVASFERPRSDESFGTLLDPQFSVPTHLRPCCALGHDLEVRVSSLPIPLVAISNIVDPGELGNHAYDGGFVSLRHGPQRAFVSSEANGLVYSCRAGFIDIAHVRDYADWTVFLARRLEATLETGLALELPEEGARRFVFVRAVDPELIERVGLRPLAVQLAQWITFNLSFWHETATWYGWSSIELFPERASAFSPEDLYSNLLGINIAGYVVQAGMANSEEAYSTAIDRSISTVLSLLGAMPPDASARALDSVNGLWWSSEHRLPSARAVLRRNMVLGPQITPWTIPAERMSEELEADHQRHCADQAEDPAILSYPTEVEDIPFAEIARIDLRMGSLIRDRLGNAGLEEGWLNSDELPALLSRIRVESEQEFGPMHDRPEARGSAQ